MKKLLSTSFILLAILSLNSQVKVNASHDSYIDAGGVDATDVQEEARGAGEFLESYYNDSKLYRRMVFFKFDLNTAPEASDIKTIKLKVYGEAQVGGGFDTKGDPNNSDLWVKTPETHTLVAYNMNGVANNNAEWSEDTFSFNVWNEIYGYSRTPNFVAGRAEGITGEGWFEIDITDEVKNYVIGQGNKELILNLCDEYNVKAHDEENPAANKGSLVVLHSKENPSNNKPHLEFTTNSGATIEKDGWDDLNYEIVENNLTISNTIPMTITITDILGRQVEKQVANGDFTHTFASKGIYILTLERDQTTVVSFKIIVK